MIVLYYTNMSKESFGFAPRAEQVDKYGELPGFAETRAKEYRVRAEQYSAEHPNSHQDPYSDTAKRLENGTLVPEN